MVFAKIRKSDTTTLMTQHLGVRSLALKTTVMYKKMAMHVIRRTLISGFQSLNHTTLLDIHQTTSI